MHTFSHADIHATRVAEAAAWRRARGAAPHSCARSHDLTASVLRNRLGEALISAGLRLIQPAHLHARIAGVSHPRRGVA